MLSGYYIYWCMSWHDVWLDLPCDLCFRPAVKTATRITLTSRTRIDLIVTTRKDSVGITWDLRSQSYNLSAWKIARLTPIYEKDDETERGNYRPVSLLSIPSNVIESIVNDALVKHRARNNFRIVSGHDDRPNSFLLGHVSFLAGQMYMMNNSFRGP